MAMMVKSSLKGLMDETKTHSASLALMIVRMEMGPGCSWKHEQDDTGTGWSLEPGLIYPNEGHDRGELTLGKACTSLRGCVEGNVKDINRG